MLHFFSKPHILPPEPKEYYSDPFYLPVANKIFSLGKSAPLVKNLAFRVAAVIATPFDFFLGNIYRMTIGNAGVLSYNTAQKTGLLKLYQDQSAERKKLLKFAAYGGALAIAWPILYKIDLAPSLKDVVNDVSAVAKRCFTNLINLKPLSFALKNTFIHTFKAAKVAYDAASRIIFRTVSLIHPKYPPVPANTASIQPKTPPTETVVESLNGANSTVVPTVVPPTNTSSILPKIEIEVALNGTNSTVVPTSVPITTAPINTSAIKIKDYFYRIVVKGFIIDNVKTLICSTYDFYKHYYFIVLNLGDGLVHYAIWPLFKEAICLISFVTDPDRHALYKAVVVTPLLYTGIHAKKIGYAVAHKIKDFYNSWMTAKA